MKLMATGLDSRRHSFIYMQTIRLETTITVCIFNTQGESNLILCYLILKMMLFFTHPLRPVNEHSKTDILTVPSFCHLPSAVNIYGVIERMFIANPCILYHIRFTWTCTWLDRSSFMDMIELLRNPRSNVHVAGETLSPPQP